jgi:hypothetical protein
MTRRLFAASLAALMLAVPGLAFAQDESTSSYSDTIPKRASHAQPHKANASHAKKSATTKKAKKMPSRR